LTSTFFIFSPHITNQVMDGLHDDIERDSNGAERVSQARSDQEQKELDDATVRYETLLHAMAVAQKGGDDFSAHLAFLEDSDEEGEGQTTVQQHPVVIPAAPVAVTKPNGIRMVEPVKTNMMLTQPATVLSKPPPSRISRYDEEDLGDIMDVVDMSSCSLPDTDTTPEPGPEYNETNMENYRQWIPDAAEPDVEYEEGDNQPPDSTLVSKTDSSESNPDKEGTDMKKKMSLRDVRKQAAAVTGIHGFGKKAKAAKEGAALKAKDAAKHTMSVIKKGVSKEGTEKARRATVVGFDGAAGVRYQFSEARPEASDISRIRGHEVSANASAVPTQDDGETFEEKTNRVSATAHKFAKLGKLESLTKYLEEQGMKPCELDRHDGWTLLHTAAEAGQSSVVAWVVRYHEPLVGDDGSVISGGNVPPSAKTGQGWTAAHVAAAHGHEEVLEVLSELGADLQAVDNSGASPLHSAAGSGCLGV
jgi:hypothetical protein